MRAVLDGDAYTALFGAADPALPPPEGAPKLEKLLANEKLAEAFAEIENAEEVRDKFAALFTREPVATHTPAPKPTAEAKATP